MPIGAETFVSAALQPLFERLFSLGEHLVMKLRNSGDLAEKLNDWKDELDVIEALLDDAEHKQFQSKAVKKWVDDLQDLALDMEDVLEDVDIELQRLEFNANMDQQQDPVPVNMEPLMKESVTVSKLFSRPSHCRGVLRLWHQEAEEHNHVRRYLLVIDASKSYLALIFV